MEKIGHCRAHSVCPLPRIAQRRPSNERRLSLLLQEVLPRASFGNITGERTTCRANPPSILLTYRVAENIRPPGKTFMLILLIVLLLVFGFGGYRLGPGIGYYGGGGISLVILIVIVLLLLRVI
jgi:hypothetical protein